MSSVAAEGIEGREEPGAFRDALFKQPDNLETVGSAAREALRRADLEPLRSGVLILTGMGASWHALAPAVLALRRAGRRAFAVAPPQLAHGRAGDLGDAFVVVSQSGASAETVAVLEQLQGHFVVAISAAGDSPLAEAADVWLPLGALPDTQVATLSYTATLHVLGLLCDDLLPTGSGSDRGSLPELVLETLRESDAEAEAVAARLREIRTLDAVGGGASVASASETALLMREGVQISGAGFETRQYLHGPLESAGPGVGCVLFGSGREVTLASSLLSYGAEVVLVSDHPSAASACPSAFVIPAVGELAAPILEILPIQLTAAYLAAARGVSIGTLRRTQADTKVA